MAYKMSSRLFFIALCVAVSSAGSVDNCPPSPCPNGTLLVKARNEWGDAMCPFDFLHVRASDGSCCLSKCPQWTKPMFVEDDSGKEDRNIPLMVSSNGTCGTCKKTMYKAVFGDVCCESLQPEGFPQGIPVGR